MKKPIFFLAAGASAAALAAAGYILMDSGTPASTSGSGTDGAEKKDAAAGAAASERFTVGTVRKSDTSGEGESKAGDRAIGFERRQSLEREGYDATGDIDAAIAKLSTLTVPSERAAFLRGLFEHLAASDRKGAMAAMKKLKDADRGMAAMTLMDAWNPEARTRFQRDGRMEGMVGYSLIEKDPVLAAEWAKEVLSGDQSKELLSRAAGEIAKQNPKEALAMAEGLAGEEKTDLLRRIAAGWAQTKPEEALAWAKQQGDTAVLGSAIRGLAENDPAAALKELNSIPAGEERTRTLDRIVGNMAGKDVSGAEALVASLSDENERKSAQQALDRAAPVGIGASVRPSRDGGLVVNNVPEGSKSGLKANDRIVAVQDPKTQQLVPISNDFRVAFDALRSGQKGETKVLQVVREGTTTPTTVSVTTDRYASQDGGGFFGRGGDGPGGGRGGRGR